MSRRNQRLGSVFTCMTGNIKQFNFYATLKKRTALTCSAFTLVSAQTLSMKQVKSKPAYCAIITISYDWLVDWPGIIWWRALTWSALTQLSVQTLSMNRVMNRVTVRPTSLTWSAPSSAPALSASILSLSPILHTHTDTHTHRHVDRHRDTNLSNSDTKIHIQTDKLLHTALNNVHNHLMPLPAGRPRNGVTSTSTKVMLGPSLLYLKTSSVHLCSKMHYWLKFG